jgi:hypothetical protein
MKEYMMLARWTPVVAEKVSQRVAAILSAPDAYPPSTVEVAQRTNGLLVYGDLGAAIALTPMGEFVELPHNNDSISPVREQFWHDIAFASLIKHYPDFRDLLPERPTNASDCSICSGTGWMMDGRCYCGTCRGLGWVLAVEHQLR